MVYKFIVPAQQDSREVNDDSIGIDLGIKELAIVSDGTIYKNINKSKVVKSKKRDCVGYNATYLKNTNLIRREVTTPKRVTSLRWKERYVYYNDHYPMLE